MPMHTKYKNTIIRMLSLLLLLLYTAVDPTMHSVPTCKLILLRLGLCIGLGLGLVLGSVRVQLSRISIFRNLFRGQWLKWCLLARNHSHTQIRIIKDAVHLACGIGGRTSWNASKNAAEIDLLLAWRPGIDDGNRLNTLDDFGSIDASAAIRVCNLSNAIIVGQAVH